MENGLYVCLIVLTEQNLTQFPESHGTFHVSEVNVSILIHNDELALTW